MGAAWSDLECRFKGCAPVTKIRVRRLVPERLETGKIPNFGSLILPPKQLQTMLTKCSDTGNIFLVICLLLVMITAALLVKVYMDRKRRLRIERTSVEWDWTDDKEKGEGYSKVLGRW